MDYLDWTRDIAGAALGLLTIGVGLSRLSGARERDVSLLWRLALILSAGALAASLVFNWVFPVETTVYLANASDRPREVRLGDDVVCLPGKSFDDFRWRLSAPDEVVVGEEGRETRYPIGKGTWFINTATALVSADMYIGESVAFDAVTARGSGAIRVDSHYGRPLRMFSQSSFDRVYSMDGDVIERSDKGPCPKTAVAADAPAATPTAATGQERQ